MKFAPFRSATAAKIFASQNAAQVPNFFMSTPQFNRQRQQLAHYSETAKTSYGLDPGALGTPTYAVPLQSNDEDDKEKLKLLIKSVHAHPDSRAAVELEAHSQPETKEDMLEAQATEQQDLLYDLKQLQASGQHTQVLECLAELEQTAGDLPLPAEAYTIALTSLAELSIASLDVAPLLEAFQRIITSNPSSTAVADAVNLTVSCLLRISFLQKERRKNLANMLGDSSLETVADVLAGVDPADPLRVALEIVRSSSSTDKQHIEQLIVECVEMDIPCQDLAPLVSGAAAHTALATKFEACTLPASPTPLERKAYLSACFKFRKFDRALEVDQPATLQGSLLLARHGFVSLAARRSPPCSELLEAVCESKVMSTSSLLYDRLVAMPTPALCAGRNAYLRLCVSAQDDLMLLKAIKESNLRKAVWDPSTILAVCSFLLERQPQLAVELFVAQSQRLVSVWDHNSLKTMAGDELISEFMASIAQYGPPSVYCALILAQSPLVRASPTARQRVFPIVWDARVAAEQDYIEFMSEQPEALPAIVDCMSVLIVGAESPLGLALPFDVQSSLHKAYPLLVSDLIDNALPCVDADRITKSLQLLKINTQPWQRYSCQLPRQADPKDDTEIIAYVNTPHGIDQALELTERQLLRRSTPGGPALRALVAALQTDPLRYQVLVGLFLDNSHYFDTQTLVSWLKAFVRGVDTSFAVECYNRLKTLNAMPCAAGFASLISRVDSPLALCLFDEARAANLATQAVCDAAINAARDNVPRLVQLFNELPHSNASLKTALTAFIKHDMETEALQVIDLMFKLQLGYEKTTEPYNKLLEYYVYQKQDRKSALRVFGYTRQAGVVLSPLSYKLLIETWLLQPMNIHEAERVLETMEAPPNTQHFSSLLRAHGVLDRNLDSAQAFYRGLVKNARVTPDQHIFSALIASYVANGKSGDLPVVLDEMKKFQVPRQQVARELTGI